MKKAIKKKDLKAIKGSSEWKSCHTSNDCRPGGNYACCFGSCQKPLKWNIYLNVLSFKKDAKASFFIT